MTNVHSREIFDVLKASLNKASFRYS